MEQTFKPVTENKFKLMTVGNIRKLLNVRREPNQDSEIMMQLSRGSKVNVNLFKSTEDYYYIASIVVGDQKIPLHGFCKREYILE